MLDGFSRLSNVDVMALGSFLARIPVHTSAFDQMLCFEIVTRFAIRHEEL